MTNCDKCGEKLRRKFRLFPSLFSLFVGISLVWYLSSPVLLVPMGLALLFINFSTAKCVACGYMNTIKGRPY